MEFGLGAREQLCAEDGGGAGSRVRAPALLQLAGVLVGLWRRVSFAGPPRRPQRALPPGVGVGAGRGLRRPGGRLNAGAVRVGLPGFLRPDRRWLRAPHFHQQTTAAATAAFPSSGCRMTAPSLVGLELAAQTGHPG